MLFGNPRMLWLLLVFPPAMIAFFWWSARVRRQLMVQFIQSRLLAGLTVGISPVRRRLRHAFLVMAVVFLIFALARPHWGFDWEETRQRGLDIVVAIDTSKSMMAEDIAPNRLARAKLAALDLMQQAKSDRLGLVAFAGSAFLQCPLTFDDSAFRQSVEALDVNIIPQGGTAIAEAIETALTAFKEGDNYKILILFTDGEDHDSGALEQAKKAAEAGLRIYTIGVGTAEGELLRVKDASGRTDYIRDEQGNVVKSHLNEQLLQDVARATEGGFYLPLRGAKTIDMLYQQALAQLPKSEHDSKLIKRYHERYHWPLAVALLLLIVEMLFPERKREPQAEAAAGRPAQRMTPAAAALLLLLALPNGVKGSPSSALREYNAGKYEEALKEYEQLLKRKGDDPRLHFNAGASAYQNKQFDEAAKQFNEALATPDLNLQGLSYYNRGNSLYHLGEKAADPSKRTEAWEKSIKDFESTLKLNPKDTDAQFNREFVKKRLEELKQQQQQQQKSDKDKSDQKQDQNQQQQQQDQQNKNDQSQKDQQQQQSQAKQDQSDQKKNQDHKQNQQANKPDEQQQQQAGQQKQDKENQDQQSAQQAAEQKEKSDEEQKEAAATAAGEMSPQQARQLLDAQKNQEQILPPNSKEKPNERRPLKDW